MDKLEEHTGECQILDIGGAEKNAEKKESNANAHPPTAQERANHGASS